MQSEIKMYALSSGANVLTYETKNDLETLWEFPMNVIFIPPQRAGMDPTIHFNPMNHNMLCKTQKAFPNLSHILYVMHPTDKLLESYKNIVEDFKMKLAGLISTPNKIITNAH